MSTQKRFDLQRIPGLLKAMKPAVGSIFYVNGYTGNDTYDGTSPETALLTISAAMDLCTDASAQNDYIIVLRYPSTDPGEASWPIAVDVESVHLIGAGLFGASVYAWINPPADTAAFLISKHGVEIAGFDIAAGATHACIENTGSVWRAHIHHNDIAWQRTAQDGIKLTGVGDDCPHWLIEDNCFQRQTRDGIRIEYNSTRTIIRNNYFDVGSGAVGVHLQGLCTGGIVVVDNKFKVTDNAAGEAITLTNANCNAFCAGNMAGQGKVNMGNIPWTDAGAGSWVGNLVTATAGGNDFTPPA